MKKILTLCLALLMLLCMASTAMAAKPGETFTVTVNLNNGNVATLKVSFSYDKNVFELQDIACHGLFGLEYGKTSYGGVGTSNVGKTGKLCTATFAIKANAAPGTYTITPYVAEAFDANSIAVNPGISGGKTVTVEAPACTHPTTSWETTKPATCAAAGEEVLKCAACGVVIDTRAIPATGVHTPGEMAVTTPATCTAKGLKEQKCAVCATVLATEEIPMTAHTPGEMAVTKPAACTEKGLKEQKCAVCAAVLATEEIPATGHDQGAWEVTKPATCKDAGEKALKCTVCKTVLKTEAIPAAGIPHTPGAMTVVKKPTCTEKGLKEQKCTVCSAVLATEEIAALGHKEGKWVTVKKATREEEGLKELQCKVCKAVLDTKVIPVVTVEYFNMRVCAEGPRFADETNVTDKWFTYAPVDLSQDGVQTIDLIAGGIHRVGTVTVTVEGDSVTVTYDMSIAKFENKGEFFTFFASLADVTTVEPEELTSFTYGTPISIEKDLAGNKNVLLYVNNFVLYGTDNNLERI